VGRPNRHFARGPLRYVDRYDRTPVRREWRHVEEGSDLCSGRGSCDRRCPDDRPCDRRGITARRRQFRRESVAWPVLGHRTIRTGIGMLARPDAARSGPPRGVGLERARCVVPCLPRGGGAPRRFAVVARGRAARLCGADTRLDVATRSPHPGRPEEIGGMIQQSIAAFRVSLLIPSIAA
jgi:hypothetical protein